ncbi:hypothetical protein CPB84DRAFT_1756979 [Gymnopilus junonius]|uniref:Uncharacterized protein n=1 Tax=Gymnopilus junonius TaxID=109634 RepID=A0A9P5N6F2_GYMJU|nr:hypothetical protein CPB84DRAFT_1756979 [Gymnopilus junonius]
MLEKGPDPLKIRWDGRRCPGQEFAAALPLFKLTNMAEADTPCPINSEASRDAMETIQNNFPSGLCMGHRQFQTQPFTRKQLCWFILLFSPPSPLLSMLSPLSTPPSLPLAHCQQPHPTVNNPTPTVDVSMPVEHPRDLAQAVSGYSMRPTMCGAARGAHLTPSRKRSHVNTHESTMEPQHGQQLQANDIGANTPPPEVPKMQQMKRRCQDDDDNDMQRAPGPNDEEDGGSKGFTESEADGSNESSEDGAHHAASKLGIMKGSSGWKERESREEVRSDDDDDDDEAHDEKHPPHLATPAPNDRCPPPITKPVPDANPNAQCPPPMPIVTPAHNAKHPPCLATPAPNDRHPPPIAKPAHDHEVTTAHPGPYPPPSFAAGRDVEDVSTQGSIMGRGRTGTRMSSHTGGKKRVGWVEQSESEELGGYGEPEGGGGEETSGSVEVIAVQYAQPQAKAVEAQRAKVTKAGGHKSKGKEKAKASRAKVQATIHLTKTEREIETSGISIAPPPQPSTSSHSTSAHRKKDSEPHGHLQSPSALSPHRRANAGSTSKSHGQAMQIEEPVTSSHHKRAISELPPWTPDNLNEDIVIEAHQSSIYLHMVHLAQLECRFQLRIYLSALQSKQWFTKQLKTLNLCKATNPKLVFCMYHHDEHDWTSYGIYTKIMAFSDDEDIDAPWFRYSNGKNIICVLAVPYVKDCELTGRSIKLLLLHLSMGWLFMHLVNGHPTFHVLARR